MSSSDSRNASNPPYRNSAIAKTDDSSSSQTPVGAPDASVAYQYVGVQQMTSARDHIEYQLTVREQPKQSRMCGVGEKADRRPIDPAPIVQLRVITHDRPVSQHGDTVEFAPAAPPIQRRQGHGSKLPKLSNVRSGLPVTTAVGDGWEDKAWYLENPYFFMYAMLCNADTDEELHLLNDGKTRYTSGSSVSCLYHLKDIDGSHQGFFVFPDLSIRVEGRYRLKLCLFETIGNSVHHCKSIYSDPFHVYTAKRFPGMEESTRLSKSFAEQGLKVRVRKHPRSRRRSAKRTKDDSDASDDVPLARDRSPKRGRASDVFPVSGLPIPQPIASSRLPRSYDARSERSEYDRESQFRPKAQELHGPPPRNHAAWEDEKAMRARDPRSYDSRFDQAAYPRHAREVDERPLPTRDFADGRYTEEYSARSRIVPSHPGMTASVPSDYPDPGKAAYPRDNSARILQRPPASSTQPPSPSTYSSFAGRGHPEQSFAQSRNYPPAPTPAALLPTRAHPRAYGPPDHAAHDTARIHNDYNGSPRLDSRYSAPYDPRSLGRGRSSPSPPPPGTTDYSSRDHYPLASSSQWRSRPSSPRLADYHPAQRSPALARGVAALPTPMVGEPGRGYTTAITYGSDPLRPGVNRQPPSLPRTRSPNDLYARNDISNRPNDLPPPERFGQVLLPSRDRPMLPPLGREREPGHSAAERYMPSASYVPRGAPSEAELEWERERAMRAGRPVREDEYRKRDWEREQRGPVRPPSGGPPGGY